jgi:hypothetical protein
MVVLLHAHVMAAGAAAGLPPTRRQTTPPKYSTPVRLLFALKFAWPLVLWPLTPATLQSAAQSIGSQQQRAQLLRVLYQDLTTRSPGAQSAVALSFSASMQC